MSSTSLRTSTTSPRKPAPRSDGTAGTLPDNTLGRLAAGPRRRLDAVVDALARALTRHSVTALRISLGLVFLGFGVLKFFPGVSPAEDLVQRTIDALTFGLVGPGPALLLTAVMETVIGLTLVTGLFLRTGLVLLAGALVGIMSPLVLFAGELFPAGGPTLTAQYVLKDVVLACAAAVIGAVALGARLRRPQP